MDGKKASNHQQDFRKKYIFQSLPECGSGPLAKGKKFQASLWRTAWKRTQTAPHRAHSGFKTTFETASK